MARNIQQIYDVIEAEKNAQPGLAALDSPSQTALYRLWMWVFAACQWVLEGMWDIYRAETLEIAARSITGTLPWYRNKATEFQWSATQSYYIVFDGENRPVYDIVSEADRIVRYAAAVDSFNGLVIVKAAKDNSGMPEPLSGPQLLSFKDYIQSIKFAGTRIQCVSFPPDRLRVSAKVYFDPISNPLVVKADVEAAVTSYLSSLPFNGIVYVEKIQDAIQRVAGVVSVEMVSLKVNLGSGIIYDVSRYYKTVAGYAIIDPVPGFSLPATISYTASNV